VKEFLSESVLPFLGVCGLILGLTAGIFDVPATPPASASRTPAASRSAVGAEGAGELAPPAAAPGAFGVQRRPPRLDQTNEVLARAVRALSAGRGEPQPRVEASARTEPGLPEGDGQKVLGALPALDDAVRAVRDARTEEDFVRAEEKVRAARAAMEATCGPGGGGPLCDSARQMRGLGY